MQGGTITNGRFATLSVSGEYWISCMTSFSKTTAPGVMARLRPTSKADSSVIEMRPFSRSPIRFLMPCVMLSPCVSSALLDEFRIGGDEVRRRHGIDELARDEAQPVLGLAVGDGRRLGQPSSGTRR